MTPQQQQGNRPETMLASEATLVPFPPGEYVVAVGGMEHPPMAVANSTFPCVCVTVLPGSRETSRLSTPDGHSSWLSKAGDQVGLTVSQPGGLILFTTYRPSSYATTGIRMDIRRSTPTQPQAPAAPPAQPQATPFGGSQNLAYAPTGGFAGQPQAAGQQPAQSLGQAPAFGQPGQGLGQPNLAFGQTSPGLGQAPAFGQTGQGFGQAPAFGQAPQGFGQAPAFGQTGQGFGQAPAFGQPAAAPQPPRAFTPPSQPAGPMPTVRMAGHLEGEGDVAFEPGQGAGRPGSKRRLEAVALYVEGVALQELEYAAIGADGQPMPWVSPPQFTGSRGTGAPMLGFAARLGGEAATRYSIAYAGSFLSAGPVPPARNGEFLRSPVAGDVLEALAVILEPKA
jgi:hypothetical protein